MNKKLFFGLAATFAVAIAVVCTTLALNNTSSKYSALQAANIEALADDEHSGLLWEKEWFDCPIAEQVILHGDCGSLKAGTYYYAYVAAQLQYCNVSYTLVSAHTGKKSYCYDGWNFCKKNDCR